MENYYELIDAYLGHQLSDEQKRAFEEEMQRDDALRLTVKHYPNMVRAVEAGVQEEIRREVRQARQDTQLPQRSIAVSRSLWQRPWAVAASVLIITVATAFVFANMQYNTTTIIHTAYAPPADLSTFQSSGTPQQTWQTIMALWDTGERDSAVTAAEAFLATLPGDLDFRVRVAHLQFQAGNYDRALELYNGLRQSREYADYAEFHSALALLELDNEEAAVELLQGIAADPDHRFRDEAADVQSHLRSFWRKLVVN